MCGVAGILNLKEKRINSEILKTMAFNLKHRGPDFQDFKIIDNIGLVHTRLKIIDMSENANQPMSNEDNGVWMVSNGEIYNYKDLKNMLIKKGHKFKSNTDVEVALHLYEEYGEEFPVHIDGMFSIAIFDRKKEKLLLVRDRMGIKPLYYYIDDDNLIFSSELKPIILNKIGKEIDFSALNYYLTFNYIPAPFTIFKKVRQILPSEILVFKKNKISKRNYWEVNFIPEKKINKEELILEEFEALLNNSVKKRMMSDVPFGVFLSGGLDSSTIAYFLRNNYSGKIDAFSVGFEEESFNELDDAKLVAENLGLNFNHIMVNNKFNFDDINNIVLSNGELFADSSILPTYYLSKFTSNHVKMVLSGDGGDEILAGYETYQAYYLRKFYRIIPSFIRKHFISKHINSLKVSYKRLTNEYKLKRFVKGAEFDWKESHLFWRTIFDPESKSKLLKREILNGIDASDYDYALNYFDNNNPDKINSLLEHDFKFYLPSDMLTKVDRASMLNSLEVRVPFLDKELVEFLAKLSSNFKLKSLYNKKYILKKSLKNKLPKRIINKKKLGFNLPVNVWFKNSLNNELKGVLNSEVFGKIGLFNEDYIELIINEHLNMKRDWGYQLWGLLIFTMWWDNFMEKIL